jgi:uncharacterized membrane protein YqjE
MAESTASFGQLATTSKLFARRLLTIGENRLELLKVEVQEESERLMQAFLLALGVAAFGLLAGLTLTAAILVMLWVWPLRRWLQRRVRRGSRGGFSGRRFQRQSTRV